TLVAVAFREVVAFPAAAGRPAAVALRGAGDVDFERGPGPHHQSDSRRGGKDVRRDRLRPRAHVSAGGSIADFHLSSYRTRAALAAHRIYSDERRPHSVIAGDHLPGAGDVAVSA